MSLKLTQKQLTILVTILITTFLGIAVDIVKGQVNRFVDAHDSLLVKQQEVLTQTKVTAAYVANSEARIEKLNGVVVDHLTEFNDYRLIDTAWKAETRAWYSLLKEQERGER